MSHLTNLSETFLSELKRRGVLRVAAVYLVSAWVAVQVAVTVTPLLSLPEVVPQWVLLSAIIGFPITLIIAWIYQRTPAGLARDDARVAQSIQFRGRLAIGVVVVAALVASAWILVRARDNAGVDPAVVAIAPFRITSADPRHQMLREGLVDLLAAKLTGESGTRAVDPRTTLAAWRNKTPDAANDLEPKQAAEIARSLGAGRLLLGQFTGVGNRITLSAQLIEVSRGTAGPAQTVEGDPDSVATLVDQLAARLLLTGAGEGDRKVTELTTTSLPALHAYLAGRVSYRRGAYYEAVAHYDRALKEDSTFALAALGRVDALTWVQSNRFPSAISHAWALRNRLSERDRQWLYAYTGRDFSSGFTYREQLRELEALLTVAADRPEAWYRWADGSLHWGQRTDYPNWLESATQGFNRALALDSSFAAPLEHLIETAILRGDTAATRKLTADYIARHPSSELNDFLRWRVGVVTGDSAAVRAARSRYPDHELSRERIAGAALFTGQSVEDAEIASRIGTPKPEVLRAHLLTRLGVGMALGRTSILREVTNRSFQMPLDASIDDHILDALVHSGFHDDSAFTALEQRLKNLPPLESLPVSALPYVWYHLGEWQYLHKGNITDLRKGVAALRSTPLDTVRMAQHVAIVLDALLAVAENRSDRRESVHRADSLSKEWPAELPETMNLLIARALEAVGEPKAALAAVRRRNNNYVAGLSGFATALREEGRLAELTGDREAAIGAYRHYLQIRYSADGPFRKEVDEVRLALNRLVSEPR